jgi:PAS domain S-box-containing protein
MIPSTQWCTAAFSSPVQVLFQGSRPSSGANGKIPSDEVVLMDPEFAELSEVLPPEPASVGRARRLVATAVTASGQDELIDVATLLVSEVVTNSVLHAGTEIHVRCHPRPAGLRVEVFDRSPLEPSIRNYDTEAMTGRGLALVSMLSASWGMNVDDDGKTVWFELGLGEEEDEDDGKEARPSSDGTDAAMRLATAFRVRLIGASPQLVQATVEQGDALLRELALLSLGGELDDAMPEGWQVPQFDVTPILAAAEAAAAAGQANADLVLSLPPGAETAAIERLRLIDVADALAREGKLLSAPALPEVAVCRHWLYSQVAEQAAGFPPQPWELPEPLEPARVAARLPPEELERSERATAAIVVADDANRIIFVNQAAGKLFGWGPSALVGRRLTVLIPPDLREAHLAGFSRLQVTQEPRILGTEVRVPALRHDGSTVEVTLVIEQLAGPDGRSNFRGTLAPTAEGGGDHSVIA